MVKVRTCECCGHPIPPPAARFGFTPIQSRLYEVVRRAGTVGVGIADIMEFVYADNLNGGPENPNVIHVHRSFMKPKLAKHGLQISSSRGHGALWRLKPL